MSDLRWVHSEGGPLLLLPVALLRDWGGVAAPPPGREIVARFRWDADGPATDYDRACDVSDYVGVIPIGAGEGLVLGDEPSATTWLPRVDGGLLARWVYALGDEQAAAALGRVPSTLPWEMAGEFEVDSSPLELFDSGEPGPDVHGERLRVELVPGSYAISHAAYEPDPDTAFRIIRLRRNIRHE